MAGMKVRHALLCSHMSSSTAQQQGVPEFEQHSGSCCVTILEQHHVYMLDSIIY